MSVELLFAIPLAVAIGMGVLTNNPVVAVGTFGISLVGTALLAAAKAFS